MCVCAVCACVCIYVCVCVRVFNCYFRQIKCCFRHVIFLHFFKFSVISKKSHSFWNISQQSQIISKSFVLSIFWVFSFFFVKSFCGVSQRTQNSNCVYEGSCVLQSVAVLHLFNFFATPKESNFCLEYKPPITN